MQRKGRLFFNIIIIVSVTCLIGAIGYALYYYISNFIAVKEAEDAVEEFEKKVIVVAWEEEPEPQPQEEPVVEEEEEDDDSYYGGTYYRGYEMIGTIQIPCTGVRAPIVDRVTVSSIAYAVGLLYGPGLNEVGNTVLVAHNYRDGTFFSNNKYLEVGDLIYITDERGRKIEYTVTNTYITDEHDFSYATRNTDGKREISLSTCTTDPTQRLVIWARQS